jgi:hypothetical protein
MDPYCPLYIEFTFNLNKLLLLWYYYCSFSIIIAHLVLLLLIQYYYCQIHLLLIASILMLI